jgi:hypothetical protein
MKCQNEIIMRMMSSFLPVQLKKVNPEWLVSCNRSSLPLLPFLNTTPTPFSMEQEKTEKLKLKYVFFTQLCDGGSPSRNLIGFV